MVAPRSGCHGPVLLLLRACQRVRSHTSPPTHIQASRVITLSLQAAYRILLVLRHDQPRQTCFVLRHWTSQPQSAMLTCICQIQAACVALLPLHPPKGGSDTAHRRHCFTDRDYDSPGRWREAQRGTCQRTGPIHERSYHMQQSPLYCRRCSLLLSPSRRCALHASDPPVIQPSSFCGNMHRHAASRSGTTCLLYVTMVPPVLTAWAFHWHRTAGQ